MPPRTTRRILWIGALLLVPLPMLQVGALIPVTRYLLLSGVAGGLILAEGSGRIPWALFFLILGHALVYAGLLWVVAWALARGLHAAAPRGARTLALALVVGGAVLALATEPYRTPFAPDAPRANLLRVLR